MNCWGQMGTTMSMEFLGIVLTGGFHPLVSFSRHTTQLIGKMGETWRKAPLVVLPGALVFSVLAPLLNKRLHLQGKDIK